MSTSGWCWIVVRPPSHSPQRWGGGDPGHGGLPGGQSSHLGCVAGDDLSFHSANYTTGIYSGSILNRIPRQYYAPKRPEEVPHLPCISLCAGEWQQAVPAFDRGLLQGIQREFNLRGSEKATGQCGGRGVLEVQQQGSFCLRLKG